MKNRALLILVSLALTGCLDRTTTSRAPAPGEVVTNGGAVTAGPTGQVQLSWSAVNGEQDAFDITVTSDNGSSSTKRFNEPARSATITGLEKGRTFTFKISGVNGAGSSAFTAELTATPQ